MRFLYNLLLFVCGWIMFQSFVDYGWLIGVITGLLYKKKIRVKV